LPDPAARPSLHLHPLRVVTEQSITGTDQVSREGLVSGMTTSEGEPMTATAERERGAEGLLLAEAMRGREENGRGMIEYPLLMAALMRGREERRSMVEMPLLLALLMRRGEHEHSGSMMENPMLMAALMHGREERRSMVEMPLLLALLMRRGEHEHSGSMMENPMLMAALMRQQAGEASPEPRGLRIPRRGLPSSSSRNEWLEGRS
jgi:uridine kinase